MAVINVLPKQVAELIAAGEVVERPSSVIKELVENSIDAGSTLITVEIKNGGVTFMRVTDDGCGIAREDVTTAFMRHATSKVSSENDLNSIATLGFRGEALAAISSVSRVDMLTKTRGSEIGTAYSSEGSNSGTVNDAGCPDGTTIIIRDLFFNTPARMKFLKKDVAEGNSVAAILDHIAMSHPEISFRFIRDGKQVFVTPGDGKLLSAIYAVCGREFASTLIPVEGEMNGIKVSGYTCRPTACRPKKNAQFVFLNGRYVRSGTVAAALDAAYKNMAMVGRFPAAVLHLTVPYGAVDINVHPAKTEVRFSDERRIFDCVMFSIKNALAKGDERPEMSLPKRTGQTRMSAEEYRQTVLPGIEKKREDPINTYSEIIARAEQNKPAMMFKQPSASFGKPEVPVVQKPHEETKQSYFPWDDNPDPKPKETVVIEEIITETVIERKPQTTAELEKVDSEKIESIVAESVEAKPVATEHFETEAVQEVITDEPETEALTSEIEYIGEAFKTYIIVRKDDSLFLIDKHAAHERILFNKLKSEAESNPQMLLAPLQVVLRKDEYTVIVDSIELLEKAGFEIEDYGDSTVLVRAIPSALSSENIDNLISELAGSLNDKNAVEIERLERIYETVSCRAAVKGGNLSSPVELKALAEAVLGSKEIMYCPHGRPVAMELKKREIEKQFGRIQ
ncbi:MAG: DNA mismatch repair endonuclease MutL [Clostridia bacterium]|nr:DNA mismatch repair endonuclease MutL [Clostridia bacterium]